MFFEVGGLYERGNVETFECLNVRLHIPGFLREHGGIVGVFQDSS
jgi:hypothetical protein